MAVQLLCQNGACSGSGGPGCTAQTYSNNTSASITGSASVQSGTMFFSNGPESLYNTSTGVYHLADPPNGQRGEYCLLETGVSGDFQLFTWHLNNVQYGGSNYSINSEILLHNTSGSTVTITVSNYGTGTNWQAGVDMWMSYWNSSSVPYSIPNNSYLSIPVLAISSVNYNYPYGVIAHLNTTGPIDVYDIAYISNSSTAFNQAAADGGVRGLANGFWLPITTSLTIVPSNGTVPVNSSEITTFTCFATPGDTFSGSDVPTVTDPSGSTSPLNGCYGCQGYVSLTVTNGDSANSHTFLISVGNLNTTSVEVAIDYTAGPGGCDTVALSSGEYINIIQDTLSPGANNTYTFQLTSPGGYYTPIAAGVTVTS